LANALKTNCSDIVILITYTTRYRKGGAQFIRAANTLTDEKKDAGSNDVTCVAVESKGDLKALFVALVEAGEQISEFHFIGHAGMYGPMFGTESYPEQFSPWEWEQLTIPFAANGKAYFSCCRSARWFAPFFAQTFAVVSYGYHWYTTFSSNKTVFKLDKGGDSALYSIGCEGRKSHGLMGSVKKYSGKKAAETWKEYLPSIEATDSTYDRVSALYDAVFQDIKVREDEWNWLTKHLPQEDGFRMLDVGCGNGALLNELAPRLKSGSGADESSGILEQARKLNAENKHLSFHQIDGPGLPFPDNSFEVVTSLLSFRYLDWDPLMKEIQRVLVPGGKFLVLDMVTAPVKVSEYGHLLTGKMKHYKHRKKHPEYYKHLRELVAHPDWATMLKYNPIRSEHEMTWYLESRFPNQKVEIINIGWNARVLAFDSGDFEQIEHLKLSYP
jgi:ubiquinone/menaquinone biosynthesis C-methylase UbiE